MPNQAEKDGSIEIGDHILEINGAARARARGGARALGLGLGEGLGR